jgi:hypothetical protein
MTARIARVNHISYLLFCCLEDLSSQITIVKAAPKTSRIISTKGTRIREEATNTMDQMAAVAKIRFKRPVGLEDGSGMRAFPGMPWMDTEVP